MLVALCHCIECQRRTGATHGIAAFFLDPEVSISGETTMYARSSEAGHTVEFHFCPVCGSTVFWRPARVPERVAVAVGAFGDPAFPGPSKRVFTQYRHHWENES